MTLLTFLFIAYIVVAFFVLYYITRIKQALKHRKYLERSEEEYLEMYRLKEERQRIQRLVNIGVDTDLHDVTDI